MGLETKLHTCRCMNQGTLANNSYVTSINASQQCTCTVESHNYASPHLLCMLALDKTGEGAYSWDSDIYL